MIIRAFRCHVSFLWSVLFFFNVTATTEIYTLSLHDALPILLVEGFGVEGDSHAGVTVQHRSRARFTPRALNLRQVHLRSEEHTSELQSPMYLVCRLLLEKKKY